MSRVFAISCLLWLGFILMPESATAIVYIPGQYRDGIYVQPHFRQSGEDASKQDWLQHLEEAPARDDEADAKLPPPKPEPAPDQAK